jgi:DNA polymerase-3 subunit delta'
VTVWSDLTGQDAAIALLRAAATASTASTAVHGAAASSDMTHAWLITGPPGSGRSNLAYAFAEALL